MEASKTVSGEQWQVFIRQQCINHVAVHATCNRLCNKYSSFIDYMHVSIDIFACSSQHRAECFLKCVLTNHANLVRCGDRLRLAISGVSCQGKACQYSVSGGSFDRIDYRCSRCCAHLALCCSPRRLNWTEPSSSAGHAEPHAHSSPLRGSPLCHRLASEFSIRSEKARQDELDTPS